MTATMY